MNVKELRNKYSISQSRLEKETGIPKGRINGWEQQGTRPKAEDYEILKRYFEQLENIYSNLGKPSLQNNTEELSNDVDGKNTSLNSVSPDHPLLPVLERIAVALEALAQLEAKVGLKNFDSSGQAAGNLDADLMIESQNVGNVEPAGKLGRDGK